MEKLIIRKREKAELKIRIVWNFLAACIDKYKGTGTCNSLSYTHTHR